jgi:hypothetical protein
MKKVFGENLKLEAQNNAKESIREVYEEKLTYSLRQENIKGVAKEEAIVMAHLFVA